MSRITLNQALADQLGCCHDLTVLCDPQGAVLGVFEPANARIYEEGEMPAFDEAELDRRENRRQGISSDEVRRTLESLR